MALSGNSGEPEPSALMDDGREEVVVDSGRTQPPTETGVSRSGQHMSVTVTDWVQVGAWKWVANDETCGVCRMVFEAACAKCKYPGDDCPVVAGQCRHSFHMHCIMDWLQSQQVQQQCPLCRQEWKFPNMSTT